ncbi:uncharacterized protein LOC131330857 [Rhododendron vialii]|uniref:uncharacterized protein LOC131330857 n=1 Tax=Rhododendron vialii TaxID=182163 RepID=UPI00265FD8AE|nr:uncharacterized protein LOC131330857 [Rhododendron vialii]
MSPQKSISIQLSRWSSDLHWRVILLPPLSLLVFLSLSSLPSFAPLQSFFYIPAPAPPQPIYRARNSTTSGGQPAADRSGKTELGRSRMAVCLVGGARRFELTGPSIVERILKVYPNSDLFLHSPLDTSAFKFSLLRTAPRIAAVRIFEPKPIPETESQARVLTPGGSPNRIQGLLQYFHLVEECLTMIKAYQAQNNFTYDWIVRTRVDGYWSAPLGPENFVPGHYAVPPGSSYGGLNDRLGIGNFITSTVALSRLSLIPLLDSAGFRQINSETAFRAQLTTNNVSYITKSVPFCVVSDRRYKFRPGMRGVPVVALSSPGPLNGAKCRPCTAACYGRCVGSAMDPLWANGALQLCDAHGEWEKGWERVFDKASGKKLAAARKRVRGLKLKQCVDDFENMKGRAGNWDAPAAVDICRLGLGS